MKTNILQAKKALLALFAMLMPLLASAEVVTAQVGGFSYKLTLETRMAEVTGTSIEGDITVPSSIEYGGITYNVNSIGVSAFRGHENITSITISQGVTSIGEKAISYCSSLTSITIPRSILLIGKSAFSNTEKLSDVYINNLESWCNINFSDRSSNPFFYANNMYINEKLETELIIPNTVNKINKYAFCGFNNLTSIFIPQSVTSIDEGAFGQCTSLKKIVFEDGESSLEVSYNIWVSGGTGEGLFCGCPLEIVYLGRTLTYPSNKSAGFSPLYNQQQLNSVSIGNCVTVIDDNLFRENSSLTTINIPNSVTKIGGYAFYNCNLNKISIGECVSHIYEYAFGNQINIENVYCFAKQVPTTDSEAFDGSKLINANLYVPENAVNNYKNATVWKEFGAIEAIKVPVSEITLSQSSATLTEGESITLTATVTPEDADDTSVIWSSSNEDVAMVSSKGKVVALAVGTATITATANDGSGVSASCEVTVKEEGDGIIAIYSKSVLINARDGVLTLSGLAEDTPVTLYTTDGAMVAQQQSDAGKAKFTVDTNQVYLVHIGDKVVKIGM